MLPTPSQVKLYYQLSAGGLSVDDFCAQYPVEPDQLVRLAGTVLSAATRAKDTHGLMVGTSMAFRLGLVADDLDTIVELAGARWHQSHENIAEVLAMMGEMGTERLIYDLARRDLPLDPVRLKGLRRKCVWALTQIGTTTAVSTLHELSQRGDVVARTDATRLLRSLAARVPPTELSLLAAELLRTTPRPPRARRGR